MKTLQLFEGYGVELEYMIVNTSDLNVSPITDELMKAKSGSYLDEIDNGIISWSNELALHVLELKTTLPSPSLNGLSEDFHKNILEINGLLSPMNAMLLPTAMHPWMDPWKEMKLWPHEKNEIYEKYNSIFDCRGHGWANLQSVHFNLPFANDEEFGRLHAAIRLVLPVIPALAASSPIADGKLTGWNDTRLKVYQSNQAKIPSIAGKVIPEQVFSERDYRETILAKNYADISAFDPEGILQDEWLNSRGAIARFQRNAIEIRIIDIQECPNADLALLKIIVQLIRDLVEEKNISYHAQKAFTTDMLSAIFQQAIHLGQQTIIQDRTYLNAFGIKQEGISLKEFWRTFIKNHKPDSPWEEGYYNVLLQQGNLSDRIANSLHKHTQKFEVADVYRKLATCLQENTYLSFANS